MLKPLYFIDDKGTFTVQQPENISYLYFPLASEAGLKSAVTPNLGGDSKIDQDTFLLEPVSAENLHNNRSCRNFWFAVKDSGAYSAAGVSSGQESRKFSSLQDDNELTAGFMWQSVRRTSRSLQLESTVTSFIPKDCNGEVMYVTVKNLSKEKQELLPYAAVPVYGRSADNIRDHRHVTSLLHRIRADESGILVCPTMSFDERGHQPNHKIYYVKGCSGKGGLPESFYPTTESFLGEGGSFTHPRAVYEGAPGCPPFTRIDGREAMGAFRFPTLILDPGEEASYILMLGVADQEEEIDQLFEKCNTADKTEALLEETKAYWQKKVNVGFHTGDRDFDNYMKWVCFQPFLRRLFGCSFLPHHDYGRGGRGWRDLWQDCLSLLLMDPKDVGMMIEKNFSGVRIDGTNATIIGAGDGNFIADRNGIARVWMDHGLWPQMTTKLYIDQTGDIRILTRQVPYFKDGQARRGTELDTLWTESQGNLQMTGQEQIYTGSILEHLLIQQLTAFYEVGEHNICRLRGADWNDALDMASERGESVAFTCAYAGNLRELAELIRALADTGSVKTTDLLEELEVLLKDDKELYDNISEKQQVLARFTSLCRHHVSGRRKTFSLLSLAENLEHKAQWLSGHIRKQEWIQAGQGEGWFNSYYDNHGQAVEGILEDQVRMMLTGQVFAIMGKVAEDPQIRSIIKSADHYLYEKEIGGYRLNTDFHELKFDLGRMFGFAYGEKENGAVFSHMAVMYGNALYRRGYAKEGWKVLKSLSDTALDFNTSRIYPGIPEYFRSDGRGMYHYLTGAASWYMLTMVTQVFGVRGEGGDLIIAPKLLAEQFDSQGKASIRISFANKTLDVIFENADRKDYGNYTLASAVCEGRELPVVDNSYGVLSQKTLDSLGDGLHSVTIILI